MKTPKRVKVGPHVYRIESGGVTADALDQAEAAGMTHVMRSLIRIDTSSSATQAADTLLHEALHAVWSMVGFRSDSILADKEEEMISRLTPALLGLIRDNPKLVRYMVEADNG